MQTVCTTNSVTTVHRNRKAKSPPSCRVYEKRWARRRRCATPEEPAFAALQRRTFPPLWIVSAVLRLPLRCWVDQALAVSIPYLRTQAPPNRQCRRRATTWSQGKDL